MTTSARRILLFSDLHCDASAARDLVRRSAAFDVVVGAGDFATMHRGLDAIIAILLEMRVPAVLVPGNSETADELRAACREWDEATVLHGSGTTVAGISFFGIGGGIPVTPFGDWSYDFMESDAEALLRECPAGGVLVTHSPPHGLVDVSGDGKHLGSTAVRRTVETMRPRLVVCGHIHARAGEHERCGDTVVVNAGPLGVEWRLEEETDDEE
jgi:Icc-related predicted phosphoesterase